MEILYIPRNPEVYKSAILRIQEERRNRKLILSLREQGYLVDTTYLFNSREAVDKTGRVQGVITHFPYAHEKTKYNNSFEQLFRIRNRLNGELIVNEYQLQPNLEDRLKTLNIHRILPGKEEISTILGILAGSKKPILCDAHSKAF